MIYLFDTSALLIHFRREAGFERLLNIFDDLDNDILLSSASLAEFGRVLRNCGLDPEQVNEILDAYIPLFSDIVSVDEVVARASLALLNAVGTRIPTIDSLIAASAQIRGACLVHRDGHFRVIPSRLLPTIYLGP